MSAPAATPQTAAEALWNRLAHVSRDDGVEVDRIIWQLRSLAARRSGDFVTRVTLAVALLMRGAKADACPHLEAAWGLRHGRSFFELSCLHSVLLDIGRLKDARTLCESLLEWPEAHADQAFAANVAALGLRIGDLALLKRTAALSRDRDSELTQFISNVEQAGLTETLRLHQEIVESVLGEHTCTFDASIHIDDEGVISASLEYFTDIVGRERLHLYRHIAERKITTGVVASELRVSIGICGPEVQAIEAAA